MKIDRYTPAVQLKSRFIWLRQNDYIDDNELETLMKKLEQRMLIEGE